MKRNSLALLVALGVASSSFAGQMKHPAGFTFWTPDDWKAKTEGMVVDVRSPAGDVFLVLAVPANMKKMDEALAALPAELAAWCTDVKFGEPEEGKEEGVDYIMAEGTGKAGGKPVTLAVGVFHSEGEFLMAFAAANSDVAAKYEATIEKILDSIDTE